VCPASGDEDEVALPDEQRDLVDRPRVRREVVDRGADGGQHASDAQIDLRARAPAQVAQQAADRDHAGVQFMEFSDLIPM